MSNKYSGSTLLKHCAVASLIWLLLVVLYGLENANSPSMIVSSIGMVAVLSVITLPLFWFVGFLVWNRKRRKQVAKDKKDFFTW